MTVRKLAAVGIVGLLALPGTVKGCNEWDHADTASAQAHPQTVTVQQARAFVQADPAAAAHIRTLPGVATYLKTHSLSSEATVQWLIHRPAVARYLVSLER